MIINCFTCNEFEIFELLNQNFDTQSVVIKLVVIKCIYL